MMDGNYYYFHYCYRGMYMYTQSVDASYNNNTFTQKNAKMAVHYYYFSISL